MHQADCSVLKCSHFGMARETATGIVAYCAAAALLTIQIHKCRYAIEMVMSFGPTCLSMRQQNVSDNSSVGKGCLVFLHMSLRL